LYKADPVHLGKDDVYSDIHNASDQITGLIDGFREPGSARRPIAAASANLEKTVETAVEAGKGRYLFGERAVRCDPRPMHGEFDAWKSSGASDGRLRGKAACWSGNFASSNRIARHVSFALRE
jgi:hypothetical protein